MAIIGTPANRRPFESGSRLPAMHAGGVVVVKATGRRGLITAELPEQHYQVEYLDDPAEDPIDADSSVWEGESGIYEATDLQELPV